MKKDKWTKLNNKLGKKRKEYKRTKLKTTRERDNIRSRAKSETQVWTKAK